MSLGPLPMFDEARKAGVVCILAAEAVQTLIIKVLQVKTGDLLEAGRGEGKVRRTVFAADSVSRHRSGGSAASGCRESRDCGMRSDWIGAGVVTGARRRGDDADYRSRLRGGKQSAAAVAVRGERCGRVFAQGDCRRAKDCRFQFGDRG